MRRKFALAMALSMIFTSVPVNTLTGLAEEAIVEEVIMEEVVENPLFTDAAEIPQEFDSQILDEGFEFEELMIEEIEEVEEPVNLEQYEEESGFITGRNLLTGALSVNNGLNVKITTASSFRIFPGEVITLGVSASSDNSDPLTFKWYEDYEMDSQTGEELNSAVSTGNVSTLTICPEKSGIIVCETIGKYGKEISTFNISIDSGLAIKMNSHWFEDEYGSVIEAKASVSTNYPNTLKFQWYEEVKEKDGTIKMTEIPGATDATLKITVAEEQKNYYFNCMDQYNVDGCYVYVCPKTNDTNGSEMSNAVEITAGETKEAIISVDGGCMYFKFVPEYSGFYRIYSTTSYVNSKVTLYDAYGSLLAENDDADDETPDFCLNYRFEAEKIYYIAAGLDFDMVGPARYLVTVEAGNEDDDEDDDEDEDDDDDDDEDTLIRKKYEEVHESFVGQTITLDPEVTTTIGQLSYQWYTEYYNEEDEEYENAQEIEGATEENLILDDLEQETVYYYMCRVSNGYTSCEVHFTVNVRLAIDVNYITSAEHMIKPGDEATLSLNAVSKRSESVIFKWFKDYNFETNTGTELTGAVNEADQSTLKIIPDKTGQIVCQVTDGYTIVSVPFYITIESELEIYQEKNEVFGDLGSEVTMKIFPRSAYPETLKIQWYEIINTENDFSVREIPGATQDTLTVTVDGIKNYYIEISDQYNTQERYFSVYPSKKLTAFAEQSIITVNAGESIVLKVNASTDSSYEPITYCWYMLDNGDNIKLGNNTNSYKVENVTDLQKYKCVVSDKYSEETVKFYVGLEISFDNTALDMKNAVDIKTGEKKPVYIPMDGAEMYLKFIPEETGVYKVYSADIGKLDPCVTLLDADGTWLAEEDDIYSSLDDSYRFNFIMRYKFEAGKTYYIVASLYDSLDLAESGTYSVIVEFEGSCCVEHNYLKDIRQYVAPTCNETGKNVSVCTICEDEQIEILPSIDHIPVYKEGVAATCTTPGLTEGSYCSKCEEVIIAQEEIPIEEHKYDGNNTCAVCGIIGGFCGADLTWTLMDGVLTIAGNGQMETAPWKDYYNQITEVEIGYGTESIIESAFRDCSMIKNVDLAESVKTIGANAFCGCSSLETVQIPAGVTQISNGLFESCKNLISVTLPYGIVGIGNGAFLDCSELEEILIPNTVTTIGKSAFRGCRNLCNIVIPEGVTVLEEELFFGCSALADVQLSANLTSIGHDAFNGCDALEQLVIPSDVRFIDYNAFITTTSGIAEVIFQGDAPQINDTAFSTALTTCYYPAGNETWSDDVKKDYSGSITWIATCGNHVYDAGNIVYIWSDNYEQCTVLWNCANNGCEIYKTETVESDTVTVNASCANKGSVTYTAKFTIVGIEAQTKVIEIPADDHKYEKIVTAPTCTKQGYTTYRCICGYTYKDNYVDAIEHDKVIDKAVAATCTETGLTEGSHCSRCKKVLVAQQIVGAFGHTEVIDEAVAPTCTATGLTAGSHCSRCDEVLVKQETIPATGKHAYGSYTVTKNSTIFAEGEKAAVCKSCGQKDYQSIPKLEGTIKLTVSSVKLQKSSKKVDLTSIVTGLTAGDSIKNWSSNDTGVAYFPKASEGKIVGKSNGNTTITVTLASGTTASFQVIVQKKAVPTTKITVENKTITLQKGQAETLKPVVTPVINTDKISYSSSNKKVVTVTSSGKITAKKSGTATITIKSGKKSVKVKVTVPKTMTTAITNVPETKELKKGKSWTIKAKLTPAKSEEKITYKSSNSKIAAVSSKGKVTAKKKGKATITIKSGKITVKCKVTVK